MGVACADDNSTSTTTNTPAYNQGYYYGTQGTNKCGTTDATGKGFDAKPRSQYQLNKRDEQNKKFEQCLNGYTDGLNATKGNSTTSSDTSSNNH